MSVVDGHCDVEVGDGDGVGNGIVDALGDGVADGDAVGDDVGESVGVSVGIAVGVGVGSELDDGDGSPVCDVAPVDVASTGAPEPALAPAGL